MFCGKLFLVKAFLFCIFGSISAFLANAKDVEPVLLLANHADIRLIPTSNPKNTRIIATRLEKASFCDFVFQDQLIYWITDDDKGKIRFLNMSSPPPKTPTILPNKLERPDGLACDWINKKLYWTDAGTHRIEISELDGSNQKIILWRDLGLPRAIVLDPHHKVMYWTDWGAVPKIEKAGMDGSHRQVLVNESIYWPNGLTIDYEENKIYWVEAKLHYISKMNADGTGREIIITNEGIIQKMLLPHPKFPEVEPRVNDSNMVQPFEDWSNQHVKIVDKKVSGSLRHPYAITVLNDRIYWTDWSTSSVNYINKNGSGSVTVIDNNGISPMDIHVYSSARQKSDINPCSPNNGGCSHLCLLSPDPPNFYTCACPTGIRIMSDNKTCPQRPEEILLLARRQDLRTISLDTEDHSIFLLPMTNVRQAVAVDFDPVEDHLYWTDDERKAIVRAHLDGSDQKTLMMKGVEQPDGLAVDWVARNLYWADPGHDTISVSRLDGTHRKILIESGIDEPRSLAVDPISGYLYWTDWGNFAKIERADLDGENRINFVESDIMWPNGLTLDLEGGVVFWADAYLDRIEKINFDQTNRTIILSERIPHVFGLSFHDGYIYWTDWQRRRIERMLVDDVNTRHIVTKIPDVMGIKVTRMTTPNYTNPCAYNNSGCSHLCFFTPKGPKCGCPLGMELASDPFRCIQPEAFLFYSFSPKDDVPNENGFGISGFSLDSAKSQTPFPFNQSQQVVARKLDFHVVERMVYWTDARQPIIYQSNIEGSNIRSFVSVGIEMLEGIAVDWTGRNVYWADGWIKRILVARMDSGFRRTVVTDHVVNPSCLAADPIMGYLYWSEWGNHPSIMRVDLDGSNVLPLITEGIGRANSLTIDYENQKLYWVDFEVNMIMSSDASGKDLKTIMNGNSESILFSIALYDHDIFWYNMKSLTIEKRPLLPASDNITNSIRQSSTVKENIKLEDMLVFHASRQQGFTPCSTLNGGCQYFCFSLPNSRYKCECPAHYQLNKDNQTCSEPLNYLLMSQTKHITRLVFESSSSSGPNISGVIPGKVGDNRSGKRSGKNDINLKPGLDSVLPIESLKNICSLDYDTYKKRIFWIDCERHEIKSALANGTDVRTLRRDRADINQPYDLAIDVFARRLYWSDSISNSIYSMSLDGKFIGKILSDKTTLVGGSSSELIDVLPRKIVIDTTDGALYFTNVCRHVSNCRLKILKVSVSGEDCIEFFTKSLTNITALAIDVNGRKLYWANVGCIEYSKLDGSDRRVLVKGINKVMDMTIFGKNLYFIEPENEDDESELKITDKNQPADKSRNVPTLIKGLRALTSAYEIEDRFFIRHPCWGENGGCSHICVPNPDHTRQCACPESLLLKGDTCVDRSSCKKNDFSCKMNGRCIPSAWTCDGMKDCDDGSDEEGCNKCQKNTFNCNFSVDDRNHGHVGDANTEGLLEAIMNGPHNSGLSTQCIDSKLVCDNNKDCWNGNDELNCASFIQCKINEIRCQDKCILKSEYDPCQCEGTSCQVERGVNMIAIVVAIVAFIILLLIVGIALKRCTLRVDSPKYTCSVVTFRPDSTGNLNVNLAIQSPVENSNQSGSNSGYKDRNTSNQSSGSQWNFSITGHSRMDHGHVWTDSVPYSGLNPAVIDRPSITGTSSSSSGGKHTDYLPRYPQMPNPPPSPATDRSAARHLDCHCSEPYGPHNRCRSYRPRRGHRNYGPPPPTPCQTDTCDDVDTCCCNQQTMHFTPAPNDVITSGGLTYPSEPPPPYALPHCWYCYQQPGADCYRGPPVCRNSHRSRIDNASSSGSASSRRADRHLTRGAVNSDEVVDSGQQLAHRSSGSGASAGSGSQRRRNHGYVPRPFYQQRAYDIGSDSDPFAPPPTPRSQYMSDCYFTHGETTEGDEDFDEAIPEKLEDQSDETTALMQDQEWKNQEEKEEDHTTDEDDVETVLSVPQHHHVSTSTRDSLTDHGCYNPPPSPVTD